MSSLVKTIISVTAIMFTVLCQLTAAQAAWSGLQDLGGTLMTDPSCTFLGNGAICGVVDAGGRLEVNRFDGAASWSGFTDLGGIVIGKPSCTYFGLGNVQALCAVVGTDSSVFANFFNGASWSGFQPLGGVSISDPVCTGIVGTNQAFCAIIGPSGSLAVNHFGGANWTGFEDLGGTHIFNPTCTDDFHGGALCGAVTTTGELRVRRFNGTSWEPPTILTPHTFITADPSCTFVDQDQLICGVRGADSALYVSRFDGIGWLPFQNLGGVLAAKPSCTSDNVGSAVGMAVCAVRGLHSELSVNQFNGSAWSGYQILPGANINGAPSCTLLPPAQALCGVKGTDNALWVTMGNANVGPHTTKVPNLQGDTVSEAAQALQATGLVVGQLHNVVDNTCNNIDRVVDEAPSAGTQVLQGSAVGLSIGQKPPHPCP
jgi:PASTA domain